jgi:hypothetical protein
MSKLAGVGSVELARQRFIKLPEPDVPRDISWPRMVSQSLVHYKAMADLGYTR